jgi:hypothetical protein
MRNPTVPASQAALRDALVALASVGVPAVLDGGTLLGFWREGQFCDGDHDDIDLTTLEGWGRAPEAVAAMKSRGFEVYREWPRSEAQRHSGQLSFTRDEAKVDLMFKERKGDRLWWCVYGPKGATWKAVDRSLVAPFGMMEFVAGRPFEANVPCDVEGYLTARYGDWRTPVHRRDYSCYSTDRCIVDGYDSI